MAKEKTDWYSAILGFMLLAAVITPNFLLIKSNAKQETLLKKLEYLKKSQRPSLRFIMVECDGSTTDIGLEKSQEIMLDYMNKHSSFGSDNADLIKETARED